MTEDELIEKARNDLIAKLTATLDSIEADIKYYKENAK